MVVKKIVKQGSGVYTITIPKDIVEAKKWENAEFELELKNDRLIFKKK